MIPQKQSDVQAIRVSSTLRMVSIAQIFFALIVVLLVLATPFGVFRFHGYGAFTMEDANIDIVRAAVVLSVLGIAHASYKGGLNPSPNGSPTRKYALNTLLLGVFQWIFAIGGYLAVWDAAMYHATFSVSGYYWWVGPGFYAAAVGALLFTILGIIAVMVTRKDASRRP